MRLTRRDVLATLFVAAAAALYALWQTGTAVVGMSTRVLGALVFGLGWAGCMSDQGEMASVYGAGGRRRAPMVYVVVASLLGAVALVAGIMTLISASETMLAILVAATVVLWVLATVRHAVTSQGHPSDQPVRGRTRPAPTGPAHPRGGR
jgi:amino acid permease